MEGTAAVCAQLLKWERGQDGPDATRLYRVTPTRVFAFSPMAFPSTRPHQDSLHYIAAC